MLGELSAPPLAAGWTLGMLSDRPLLGAKAAGCWILLSLREYAPDLNVPVRGSCAEPNSKQFVLLSALCFCLGRSAAKKKKKKAG